MDGAEDLNCSWQAAQVVKDGSLPGMMLGRTKLLFLVMVARLQAKMELARWLRCTISIVNGQGMSGPKIAWKGMKVVCCPCLRPGCWLIKSFRSLQ